MNRVDHLATYSAPADALARLRADRDAHEHAQRQAAEIEARQRTAHLAEWRDAGRRLASTWRWAALEAAAHAFNDAAVRGWGPYEAAQLARAHAPHLLGVLDHEAVRAFFQGVRDVHEAVGADRWAPLVRAA